MSTIFCPNCGAPNRETAKYCGKCAGLLAPLSPATMVMDYEPERKRRRRRRSGSRRAARPAKRSPWPFVLIVCLALGAGLASAWITQQYAARNAAPAPALQAAAPAAATPPAPPAPAPAAQTPAPEPAPSPAPEDAATPDTPAPDDSAAPSPANGETASQAADEEQAPAPAVETPAVETPAATAHAQPAARLLEHRKTLPPGNRRAAAPRPATAPAHAAAPLPEPPPAAAPTPVAPPPPTPAQACAGRQFLARSLCLQQECSKPGMGRHAVCVQMRERERALQQGSGGA